MESKMFSFVLFMFFCIVQSSAVLKCYTCDSGSNPQCADIKEYEGFQASDCTSLNYLSQGFGAENQLARDYLNSNIDIESLTPTCLKMVYFDGTRDVVSRNCGIKTQNKDLCTAVRAAAKDRNTPIKYCGTCDEDGCNSGNSMQLFSTLIVFGAMVCTARLFV